MAIENPSLSQGTGEGSRGATLVKPPLRQHALAIKHKNLPVLATGFQQSQLHSIEYANPHGLVIPFALVTVASPAQATQVVFVLSPYSSKVHSALSYGRGSHHCLALWAAVSMLTRPLHSFFVQLRLFISK